ncbi:MAG: DUF5706 domain-containing protein [Alphaproteobacteria bacterium]|nr:DUF5706 domain-containing protein [Alphaproteobacteria bacterium]
MPGFSNALNNAPEQQEDPHQKKWEAVARGAVIGATMSKFTTYISIADQRARGMILVNSFIIPVAMAGLALPGMHWAALLAICASLCSIVPSMIALYPKHRSVNRERPYLLFHRDIAAMEEEEYLEAMRGHFNEPHKLSELAVRDFYNVSKRVIGPKFFWIKVSYLVFFFGNGTALLLAALSYFRVGV